MTAQDKKTRNAKAVILDVVDTTTSSQANETGTPEVVLEKLAEDLTGLDGVDTDLADILTDHLLKISPDSNALAHTKSAISALASERAASTEENSGG